MRQTFLLLMLFSACILGGCGNNEEKNEGTDTVAATTDTTAAPAELPQLLVILHSVKDYRQWKPIYDSHDSARLAAGLHNFVIARGLEDSNKVLVAFRVDDTARARIFAADPSLKAAMQKGGVVGKPEINIDRVVMLDRATDTSLNRVLVRHHVQDWASWRRSFDSGRQARLDAGLTDRIISRGLADSNNVAVVCTISDMAKARSFMNSKELKDRMARGGVHGQPVVFMYRVVERY